MSRKQDKKGRNINFVILKGIIVGQTIIEKKIQSFDVAVATFHFDIETHNHVKDYNLIECFASERCVYINNSQLSIEEKVLMNDSGEKIKNGDHVSVSGRLINNALSGCIEVVVSRVEVLERDVENEK